jgi:hypothetical protein
MQMISVMQQVMILFLQKIDYMIRKLTVLPVEVVITKIDTVLAALLNRVLVRSYFGWHGIMHQKFT